MWMFFVPGDSNVSVYSFRMEIELHFFYLMQHDKRLVCDRWLFFMQYGKGNLQRHPEAWNKFLPLEMHYPAFKYGELVERNP